MSFFYIISGSGVEFEGQKHKTKFSSKNVLECQMQSFVNKLFEFLFFLNLT